MEGLGQSIANGIIISGTYALIAIGLTLVFGFMELVNFAHGELYMLGAYLTFTFAVLMKLPYTAALLLSIALVMLLAYLLDFTLFRPLRNQDILVRMLTTVGLMVALQNLAIVIWDPIPKRVPVPLEVQPLVVGSIRLPILHLIIILVAIVLIIGFHFFMQYTKTGMAMRATFQDREVASAFGVDVNRVYGYTFALGAGMAAAGGALLSTIYLVTPTMGSLATTKAFAVVILGGLGSFLGAILGSFILGISETLAATYIASGYKDAIAFILLVIILIVRPMGILGKVRGVE